MTRTMLLTAAAVALAQTLQAQDSCFVAKPAPKCSVFFFTNAGGYLKPPRRNGSSPYRVLIDWGVMANASPRNAIGASWFVTLDEDEFTTGPTIRYRRWFDNHRSLDVALGTAITGHEVKTGSVLGLVRYNPDTWFGVGIRPEYVRRRVLTCTPGPRCTEYTATSARVYAGVEVGEYPGFFLSLVGGAFVGLLALLIAGSD